MNNQDQYSSQTQGSQTISPPEFSTRRRAVTAVLVLVAALLLGYVVYTYTIQVSQQSANENLSNSAQPTTEPTEREYTEDEKMAILEAMQDTEQTVLTAEQEQERRVILENTNNSSADEVSEQERITILNAMQVRN
jgi:uncharacterized protein HemX